MLAKVTASILLFTVAAIFFGALVIHRTGVLYVEVEEKKPDGQRLYMPVPMLLAHAAVSVAPEQALEEVRSELTSHTELILAVCEELAGCPDGPFVEYRNGSGEYVTVAKRGGHLLVDVNSTAEKVKVHVPINGVQNLIRQIAR
ncbi:MAG TPA: hypothetical protein PLP42_12500 [Acidobacteriota bacterium]|nr:hypothetical protein [Acidobacteriota bacterium]